MLEKNKKQKQRDLKFRTAIYETSIVYCPLSIALVGAHGLWSVFELFLRIFDGVSKVRHVVQIESSDWCLFMHKMKSKRIDQRTRLTCVVLNSYISVAFWGDSVVSAEVDYKLGDSDRESREIRRFSTKIQLADSMPTSLINARLFTLIILDLGCLWLHILKKYKLNKLNAQKSAILTTQKLRMSFFMYICGTFTL